MRIIARLPGNVLSAQEYRLKAIRDRWGAVLFDFLLGGLFEHRMIHADPNLANFSFLADGRVVVYDFGCVKSVPPTIVQGYRALPRAALDGRRSEVPALLAAVGVSTASQPFLRFGRAAGAYKKQALRVPRFSLIS